MAIGAILVGGNGRRLGGVAKPLLDLDGAPLIARSISAAKPACREVILIGDAALYGHLGLRVIADHRRSCGPLAGLEAALLFATSSSEEQVLLLGGDMPFLSTAALRLVVETETERDAVVPWIEGRPEPLHARYHRRVLSNVTAQLDRGELALHRLLDTISMHRLDEGAVRAVDPRLRSFLNVNTPEEFAALRQSARSV